LPLDRHVAAFHEVAQIPARAKDIAGLVGFETLRRGLDGHCERARRLRRNAERFPQPARACIQLRVRHFGEVGERRRQRVGAIGPAIRPFRVGMHAERCHLAPTAEQFDFPDRAEHDGFLCADCADCATLAIQQDIALLAYAPKRRLAQCFDCDRLRPRRLRRVDDVDVDCA